MVLNQASFPDKIQVTLGSAWAGQYGMTAGLVLILSRVSISSTLAAYTEDGTSVANSVTNRLRLGMQIGGPNAVLVAGAGHKGTPSAPFAFNGYGGGGLDKTVAGGAYYTFLDAFSGVALASFWQGTANTSGPIFSPSPPTNVNPVEFSSIVAYVPTPKVIIRKPAFTVV